MGPPLFRGGREKQAEQLSDQLVELQWGRLSSEAEGIGQRSLRAFNQLLQWGRLSSEAEGTGTCPGHQEIERLQWGRLSSEAEGASTIGRRSWQGCFNGAASLQRRKEEFSTQGRRVSLGFNGAASLQRRKEHRWLVTDSNILSLQWGRLSSEAEGDVLGRLKSITAASMGPPLFRGGREAVRTAVCGGGPCFNGAASLQRRKGKPGF